MTRQAKSQQSGSILFEYGLYLPILITMLLGAVDYSRLALQEQKVHRVAMLVGDYMAQNARLTEDAVQELFTAARALAQPVNVWGNGRVFVSVLELNEDDEIEVVWQRSDGAALDMRSEIGGFGSIANLPEGITVREDQPVVSAEVMFRFEPLFLPEVLAPRELSGRAIYRPRRDSFNIETVSDP